MQRQHLSQRVLSLLLACVMFLTCAPTALAESTEAAMMRLMKTEGTVSVTNAKGRSVKTRDDMRLNSGYGLETEEASYAWINLDDAKLVKMDAVSEISIRKSGKKLDILVNAGSLFFNVSKPLEEDETFSIRTSTMGIGLRGTCGWVKVIDQWTSQLYVLEGTVEVTVTDPVTGETKTDTVKGGETVTCKVYPQDRDGSKCDIIRQGFTVSDIDGFVLVELVGDRPLCEKIHEDSGLDILGSGINAAQKLKEDQEAVHEKLERIKDELAEMEHDVSKDPVWANPVSDGTPPSESSGDDSGSSGGNGSAAPVPAVNQELTMPQTDDTVNEYLSRSDISGVTLLPGTARASTTDMLEVDSGITVPAGKSLTLRTGVRMEVLEGQTVALGTNAHVTIGGAFISAGNLTGATGATVKATLVDTTAPLEDWKQSDSTDGAGYYTLTYSPKGVYTVTFDPNLGTVSPTTATTGTDGRLTSLPTPTREGYIFAGWYMVDDGSVQVTTSTVFTADTAVYARWMTAYIITFDSNGGTLYLTTLTTDADGKLAELPTPARDGYTFDGWFTAASGGAQVTTSYVFTAHTTVYAHWTAESTSGVTWRYDEPTKTLYIEGSGAMEDYSSSSNITTAPWGIYATEMQSLVIGNGVTSIGNQAFYGCSSLTGVLTIPSSVLTVGYGAFSGCSRLTGLVISDGVTSIGHGAFYECSGMTGTLTIPSSVTSIERGAFYGCSGFTGTLIIPAGLTNIEEQIFRGCSGLTSVTIPASVASIGESAFSNCSGLTSVTIPNSVTSIDNYAFYSCSSLTDVYYGGTRVQWNDLRTNIGINNDPLLNATIHCTDDTTSSGVTWRYDEATTTLYIEGSGRMEQIADYGYSSSGVTPWNSHSFTITRAVISDGITTIADGAFSSCRNLTSVVIPDTVTSIGSYAFYYCTSLSSVTLPANITSMGGYVFQWCPLTSITIPAGVSQIRINSFASCSELKTVTIPASVTDIGSGAFYGCTSLTDVYYTGTRAQWEAVTIHSNGNINLTSATIRYNSPARSTVSYSAPAIYTDVPAGASYAEAVRYCKENNLMTGTSDTEFSPEGTLTRAMMVTVLHRLAGKPFAYATGSFADVEPNKWYSEAISWANSQGIVNGYNPTTFGTDDPVTHEQVGLILQRYSGDQGIQVTGAESPKTPATRAEVAVTLMNYAKNRKPGTLSEASAIDVMCSPSGIALDKDGNLMVTDVYGKQLWRVQNRNGTAYAGGATVLDLYGQPMGGYNDASLQNSFFKEPWAIAPFLDGWAVSDTANNVVRLVGVSSVQTLNGATNEKLKVTNLGVAFDGPTGLASDDDGNLYVSDTLNGAVRRVNPQGGVATVAKGLSDPTGLCWKDGVLYIAETGRNRIVKLEKGKVTTVAGSGTEGLTDGSAQEAAFASPKGVAVGGDGSVYVADTGNGAVRVIKGGTVTTLVSRDPEQLGGGLMSPTGLLVQGQSLYICDTFARKIFVYQLG